MVVQPKLTGNDLPYSGSSAAIAGVNVASIDPPLFVSQQSGLAATDTKEVDIDPSYARKRMGVRILG